MTDPVQKVRLDKWLWAARFFKTRALSKSAIDGGKIHVDGNRAKPSTMVHLNQTIEISKLDDSRTVIVTGLAEKRGNATLAATLYQETEESLSKREQLRQAKKLSYRASPDKRPDKKSRRQLIQLKKNDGST